MAGSRKVHIGVGTQVLFQRQSLTFRNGFDRVPSTLGQQKEREARGWGWGWGEEQKRKEKKKRSKETGEEQ